MIRWALAALALGCAPTASIAAPHQAPHPAGDLDLDLESCAALCTAEKRCGADPASCQTSCKEDVARMKRGFVESYVRCFLPELRASCPGGEARQRAHDRCFDLALSPIARDPQNQKEMAEAVCNRGLRCQGIGTLGRDLCVQATLDPKEPEIKLGQRLVDALRRDRAIAFRKCVDEAPCVRPDSPDDAVHDCYDRVIAGAR